jgi:hypothetical protein
MVHSYVYWVMVVGHKSPFINATPSNSGCVCSTFHIYVQRPMRTGLLHKEGT